MRDDSMTLDDLESYSEAWNQHDIDAIMSMMTEDCIFESGGVSALLVQDIKALRK